MASNVPSPSIRTPIPHPRAVLFDLDGTLLDSFSAHFQAYKEMFSKFHIRVTKKAFLHAYSPDWYRTYEAFRLPREHWSTADKYWLESAARQKPRLLPGVYVALRKLRHGTRVGLVSSGSKQRVLKDLARNRISDTFEVIVTGDDTDFPKPHPDGLLRAMKHMRLEPQQTLYVGDAEEDFEMSRAAGVLFIGVKSAFSGLRSGSYMIVNGVAKLPALLIRK